jgi:hypothetical protein
LSAAFTYRCAGRLTTVVEAVMTNGRNTLVVLALLPCRAVALSRAALVGLFAAELSSRRTDRLRTGVWNANVILAGLAGRTLALGRAALV